MAIDIYKVVTNGPLPHPFPIPVPIEKPVAPIGSAVSPWRGMS